MNLLPKRSTKNTKKNEILYIGRTKLASDTIDIDSQSETFSKSDYYKISRNVRLTLLQNKIDCLPIDLSRIILNNGWYISTFKQAISKNLIKNKKFIDNNWGFTLKYKSKFYIFINDECDERVQNFTLAHEIGHIILNHFYTQEHSKDEKEANIFAARLLMPLCVLYECNVKSSNDIQELCNVSKQAAKYRFERLQLVKPKNKFYTDSLEWMVKMNFDDFISKNKDKF